MGKGSVKGFNFEREICKELSFWWTGNVRDDVFWRTSQSGGRATTRLKHGKTTANSDGDVAAIDPVGQPFIDRCFVEIKRGYSDEVSILDFIDRKKGDPLLLKWWLEAIKKVEKTNQKEILIIFKRDRHEKCIMFSNKVASDLLAWYDESFEGRSIRVMIGRLNGVIVRLQDFFDLVEPTFFV